MKIGKSLSLRWPASFTGISAVVLCLVAALGGFLYSRHAKQQRRVLRVGFSQFAPYVLVNANGAPEGLATEMVIRAARQAGIPIRWVQVQGEIDDALRNRQIDLYPLLTLTGTRKKDFYVSEPWWENEIALISVEAHPLRAASDTAKKKIAVRDLTIIKLLAKGLFSQAELVTVSRMEDMLGVLCRGEVDGFFLDLRLLESQLLKGASDCPGRPLHVASLPNGRLSLATLANFDVSRSADKIYAEIAQLTANGTLSDIASRWQLYNTFQNRHLKDTLQAQHRAALMRYGLSAMVAILILISSQVRRLRSSQMVAQRARLLAEESQQRFDAFMQHMPAVAFIKNERGEMDFANDAFCKLFGKTHRETIGKTDHQLWPALTADHFRENDKRILANRKSEELVETAINNEGEVRSYLSYKFPFANSAGEQLLGGVALDITERLRAEEALKLSKFSIDCSEDTMLWIDSRGQIFDANQGACRNLGYSFDDLIQRHVSEIDPSVDRETFVFFREQLKHAGSLTVESTHRRKDGVTYPVEIRQKYLEFQGQEYSCSMSRDITERKLAEIELSRQALHDALTGLPNRRYLERCLSTIIRQSNQRKAKFGVVYLDLDGFKLVNDTLGHAIGDQLLVKVAARLKESLRETDKLFRMGGDEFTLVLGDVADQPSVALIARKLLANLHESFTVEGHDLAITASIGVTMFPVDGQDEGELLRNADSAMYESKRQGKNRIQFFTAEMRELTRERLELENQLRRALERNEFSLHYQPELEIQSGKIVRHEALLRWNNPTLGNIPPVKFIPIAEETALIVPIGTWVLEQACRCAVEWQRESAGVGVGVNISVLQFCRADFVSTVTGILQKTGLAPYLLDLEFTESVLMRNVEDTADKINQLRSIGVTISIDDFGTGYSSLRYLQQLPINTLKIDRSFITNLASDRKAVSLIGALISIAHSLNMKVVVEGVETASQLDAIQMLDCDLAQGYFLGRPTATPAMLAELAAA